MMEEEAVFIMCVWHEAYRKHGIGKAMAMMAMEALPGREDQQSIPDRIYPE